MTTTDHGLGVTRGELRDVLDLYARLVAENPTRRTPAEIVDDLRGFGDSLTNLADTGDDARDALTAAEHRAEVGLCPDGDDHWAADCGPYECPTWRQRIADDPDRTGHYR